jgi:hypothetical protein
MFACPSPIDETRATEIVDTISQDAALMAELRYWMSGMHVSGLIGGGRLDRATTLREAVNEQLSK